MPWYTPNPAPGLPVASAWGNAVQNACQPAFATLAALNAQWSDAPDGASAFVLADRRTYRRRGGAWLLELQNVQGITASVAGPYNANFVPVVGAPGASVGTFGPMNLRGRRIYTASWRVRTQLLDAVANQSIGAHVNLTGTGNDTPLTWNGGDGAFANGQTAVDLALPLPFQGAVFHGSFTGLIITGGADDQVLSVSAQYVMNNSAAHYAVSDTQLTMIDLGAAP